MPGYVADPQQGRERFKWPDDTWLDLHVGRTVLLQIHTPFMPEGTNGLWRHDIMLPKREKPTPVPCPGSDCPLCGYNQQVGRDANGKYPFPSRRVGFAIGSIHAEMRDGKWLWFDFPEEGLIEKGPETWATLTTAERQAAEEDEMEPNKVLMEQDWTQWLFRLECTSNGIKAKAVPPPAKHPLHEMAEGRIAYYMELYDRRCRPWDDMEGLLRRQLAQRGQPVTAPISQTEAGTEEESDEGLDDIDFSTPPPPTLFSPLVPAAKLKPAPFGKPVSDLVGNVEADPATKQAIASAYAELDTLKTYQLLNKLEQLYRRYYGPQYTFAVPKHLKKLGKASVKDFTDEELRDEIIDFETRAKAQET